MSRLIAFLSALLFTGAAVAGELPGFDSFSACRPDPAQVRFSLSFMGSPCIAAQNAVVRRVQGGTQQVRVRFTPTSEVCTMNLVPVKVTQTVKVAPSATRLVVMAIHGQGGIIGADRLDLAGLPACKAGSGS